MKKEIHPKYDDATISCACGNVIHTRSTKKEMSVNTCAKCHPYFTGQQTMIETDTPPPPPVIAPVQEYVEPEQIEYLPQHRITQVPVLPEDEIRRATVYPPIAQRSNIEGVVYLELFIDRQGNVQNVRILRENPPGRGFGEAAVRAFRGIRGKPAESDGVPVAVRYRYNINFTLR